MDRLTERNPYWMGEEFWTSAREPDDEEIDKIYEKLWKYENAEEDGLLVRLPCKAGDRIWIIEKLINSGEWRLYGKETIITDIYLNAKRPPLFKATNLYGTLKLNDFGDIAFTSEGAALERLKEIESKN